MLPSPTSRCFGTQEDPVNRIVLSGKIAYSFLIARRTVETDTASRQQRHSRAGCCLCPVCAVTHDRKKKDMALQMSPSTDQNHRSDLHPSSKVTRLCNTFRDFYFSLKPFFVVESSR